MVVYFGWDKTHIPAGAHFHRMDYATYPTWQYVNAVVNRIRQSNAAAPENSRERISRLNDELQERLRPSGLHLALEQAQEKPTGQPVSILNASPKSLERYTLQLQRGFDGAGRSLVSGQSSVSGPGFAEAVYAAQSDISLVQVHGSESEEKEKMILDREYPGKVIVLVHRPEEYLLRYGPTGIELLNRKADAIVLLGPTMVAEYKRLFPDKIVVCIPHGFFEPGELDESRLVPGTVSVIGSNTTWGEMRNIDDVLNLMKAVQSKTSKERFLGFVAGKYDSHARLESYRNRSDVWFLENEAISTAYRHGAFHDFMSFKDWLYEEARGRVVIRPTAYASQLGTASLIQEWESRLVDFNVQAYHEILNHDRPKVEASGTLHMSGGPAIGVVINSPAMQDIAEHEGLGMILMPYGNDRIYFDSAADQIITLVRNPQRRREMITHNIGVAQTLGMPEIAYAYRLVAQTLQSLEKAGTSAPQRQKT